MGGGRLLLRAHVVADVDVQVWPRASYYSDGTVITPGDVGHLVVRRLTPSALEALLARVHASGLLDRDRHFMALLPNRGLDSYRVEDYTSPAATVLMTASVNARPTADIARFINLAHQLLDPVGSLPTDAWAQPDPTPYEASFVRVRVMVDRVPRANPSEVDLSAVRWPLATPFDALGEIQRQAGDTTYRCAILGASEAEALGQAFAAAGMLTDRIWATTFQARSGDTQEVRFEFVGLLPDGAPGCRDETAGASDWPDGTEIAYVAAGRIRVLDPSTGRNVVIASGARPAWSPDGRTLAFVRGGASNPGDLWLLDLASGTSRRVVPGGVAAAWSPTGALLAVNRSPIDLGETWLVGPDGTGLRRLSDGDDAAWSPDGRQVALVTGTARPEVVVVDIATGKVKRLGEGTSPVWTGEDTPRVAYLAWGTDRLVVTDPTTVRADSSTRIPPGATSLEVVPAPSAPGWALAFIAGGQAWLVDRPGDTPRALTVDATVESFSASLDGTILAAVTRTGTRRDLCLVWTSGDGWFQLTDTGTVTDAAWRPTP